jgi:hypothetical protein
MTGRAIGSCLYHGIGSLTERCINLWVRLAGRRLRKSDLHWLDSRFGSAERLGEGIYRSSAAQKDSSFGRIGELLESRHSGE